MGITGQYLKMLIGTVKRVPLFISTIIPKKKKLYIFGAWFGQKYSDNSKALFETALKDNSVKSVWITKNKEVYNLLKNQSMPVEMASSLRGIWLQCRAEVAITCTGKDDFNSKLLGSTYHIELWHGVGGGKTVGFDDAVYRSQMDNIRGRYYRRIEKFPYRNSYFVCTSNVMKKVFMGAFRLPESHYFMAGQARNDMFYDKNYQIRTIDASKLKGRKVITYMPTHRKTGAERIDCSKLFDLNVINEFCKENGCIFIIKKHFYHKHEIEQLSGLDYILDWSSHIEIDTNELLMVTDYLITDYSSVATDYLLLDRPIIYYCFDLEHYLKEDRDVYWDYDSITPGSKAHNFNELRQSLVEVLSGKDDYKLERKRVRDMFYDPSCQCEASGKILTAIENIINSNR